MDTGINIFKMFVKQKIKDRVRRLIRVCMFTRRWYNLCDENWNFLVQQFHVYSDDLEGFFKYVPRESLPSDYGGKEKSVEALQSKHSSGDLFLRPNLHDFNDCLLSPLSSDEWSKKIESYRSYFEDQESICSDESKRLNKSETSRPEYEDLFGRTGSFHKLAID